MNYENFIFYGSFLKTVEAIPDEQLRYQVLEAIVRYGCTWELPNPKEKPMVYAFLQMAIPNIDKQKDNYANGSKGGRPVSHSQEEYNELFEQGKTNKEVEEILNVSHATVERKKAIWKSSLSKDTEKDIAKDKESEVMREMRVLRLSPQNTYTAANNNNFYQHEKNCYLQKGYSQEEAEALALEATKYEI